MRSFEKMTTDAAETKGEQEHFDDVEMAKTALVGMERVRRERQMAEKAETTDNHDTNEDKDKDNRENFDEQGEYDEDDYDEDYDYEEWETNYWGAPERTEEKEREQSFELLTIPPEVLKEYQLPQDLPPGVCVMGGTARSIARRVITGDHEPVRDLDLVYIEDLADPQHPLSDEALDKLSEQYMPDDYAYGHGIQEENIKNYFATRDLTINQCLVAGDKLLVTRAAYDDLQENILRLSYYEQSCTNSVCSDRLLMKLLLLQTILKETTSSYPTIEEVYLQNRDMYEEPWKLNDDPSSQDDSDEEAKTVWSSEWENESDEYQVSWFDQALTLNKAMDRGVRTAINFTKTLEDWGVLGDEQYAGRPMALARYLNDQLYYPFCFRPDREKNQHDEHNYGSLEDLYPEVAGYTAHDKAVREEIKTYKSRPINTSSEEINEPQDGHYTAEDYEWMNIAWDYADNY